MNAFYTPSRMASKMDSKMASKAVILSLALSGVIACVPAQAKILKYVAVGVAVHMIDKKIDQHAAAKARQSNQSNQLAQTENHEQGSPAKKHFLTDEQKKSLFNSK